MSTMPTTPEINRWPGTATMAKTIPTKISMVARICQSCISVKPVFVAVASISGCNGLVSRLAYAGTYHSAPLVTPATSVASGAPPIMGEG